MCPVKPVSFDLIGLMILIRQEKRLFYKGFRKNAMIKEFCHRTDEGVNESLFL